MSGTVLVTDTSFPFAYALCLKAVIICALNGPLTLPAADRIFLSLTDSLLHLLGMIVFLELTRELTIGLYTAKTHRPCKPGPQT